MAKKCKDGICMSYLFAIAAGYLLGCSNMALYICKLKNIDIRKSGSNNLGAANSTIVLGWRYGILVGIHDIGKAIVAVLLTKLLFPGSPYAGAVAGMACVLGHIFPFPLKFKGGKGFASFLGLTVALNWKFALVVLALVVVITLVTDYLVAGTLTTIVIVPAYLGFSAHNAILPLVILVATAVIFYKHRENIPRMLNGTEIGLRSTLKKKTK